MKLTVKLISTLIVTMAVILSLDGLFAVRRDIELYQADMRRDARLLGGVLKTPVTDAWRAGGKEKALEILANANSQTDRVSIHWVWLDTTDDAQFKPEVPLDQLKDVRRGHDVALIFGGNDGRDYLYTYVAIPSVEGRAAAIEIRESFASLRDYVRGTTLRTARVVALSLVVGAAGVVILGLRIVGQPLEQLRTKAIRIGNGDLSGPLAWHRRDELGELAQTMDTMCELLSQAQVKARREEQRRIEILEQAQHSDRLRTVGRLAAGVAHELGTSLNTISIHSGMIARREIGDEETIDSANVIRAQSRRMTEIIRGLLDYARHRPPQKRLTDVRADVQKTLLMLAPFCEKRHANLCWHTDGEPALAAVDPGQIEQVVTNLVVNAVQAMPQGGDVHVEICRQAARPPTGEDAAEEDVVCIVVRDEGPGISDEDRRHIFDPFFTTKEAGEGTGLGLSIAHGIVEEHRGWIDVKCEPNHGSCFTVFLPAAPADKPHTPRVSV